MKIRPWREISKNQNSPLPQPLFEVDSSKDEVINNATATYCAFSRRYTEEFSMSTPEQTPAPQAPKRQYVNFAFYKVDPAWRRLPE